MTNPHPHPIPVLCDCCRARGVAGEGDFASMGDLLDFDPVPRRKVRADGWSPEVQRAFIVALAATGSARRACAAVGKAQFGADQLRRAPGNEGFLAAWDAAMALFQEKESRRIAAGIEAVAGEGSAWSPPPAPWSHAASRHLRAPAAPDPAAEPGKEERLEWFYDLVARYMLKVESERTARLAGKIVDADFCLRQLTWLEVAIDLASGDGFQALLDFRHQGWHLIEIAETPMSRLLGDMRRKKWAELGDPPRPDHPPRHLLADHGRFKSEPLEFTQGGVALSHKEQQRIFEERHKQAAAEQLAWEEAARRDYEERRASDASS